ncbi:PH domain-containing protein [Serinicoccus sp. LYQ131]|uniref:PH domain-containing protein n=1 Tax=Serinicoccus sp. LYQ131 TaxID=3378797 RepID=UPI003851E965
MRPTVPVDQVRCHLPHAPVPSPRADRTSTNSKGLRTRAGKQHRSIPWDEVRDIRSSGDAPLAPAYAHLLNGERLPLPGVMDKDVPDVLAWRPRP